MNSTKRVLDQTKKVLVIEDVESSRLNYAETIEDAGYDVDAVGSLDDAIDAIDRKTYHVAVVDITLDVDDVFNRDGMRAIQYLQDLNEGTESVILSGQEELDVAVEAFHKFGLVQYLNKKRVKKPSDITSAVDKAFEKASIKHLGRFDSVSAVFSGKGKETVWEHRCLQILRPSEGMAGFGKFLQGFAKPLTPLLPRRDAPPQSAFDEAGRRVTTEFWSKGVGSAVRLVLTTAGQAEAALADAARQGWELLHQYEKANTVGLAFSSDLGREQFAPHLFDKA